MGSRACASERGAMEGKRTIDDTSTLAHSFLALRAYLYLNRRMLDTCPPHRPTRVSIPIERSRIMLSYDMPSNNTYYLGSTSMQYYALLRPCLEHTLLTWRGSCFLTVGRTYNRTCCLSQVEDWKKEIERKHTNSKKGIS